MIVQPPPIYLLFCRKKKKHSSSKKKHKKEEKKKRKKKDKVGHPLYPRKPHLLTHSINHLPTFLQKKEGPAIPGAVDMNQYGKYGIIRESDFHRKKRDFEVWCQETQNLPEIPRNHHEALRLFRFYMEVGG